MEGILEKYSNNAGHIMKKSVAPPNSNVDPSITWPPPGVTLGAPATKDASAHSPYNSPRDGSSSPPRNGGAKEKKTVCSKCNNRRATTRCFDCEADMCDLCHRNRHICGPMATHQCVSLRMWNTMPQYNEMKWRTETVIMKGAGHCRVCRRFVYKGREATMMAGPRLQIYFHPECHDSYFVGGNSFTREWACPGVPFLEGIFKKPIVEFDRDREIKKAVTESLVRNARARQEDLTRPSCTKFGKDYCDKPGYKYRYQPPPPEERDFYGVL